MLLPGVAAMCALGCSSTAALTGDLIAVSLTLAVAAVIAGVVRWLMAVRREAQAAVLRDVADELARKAEQQATVADLGRQAVANGDEQGLMELAVKVVADSLGADRVAVLELAPGGRDLLLRAESGGGGGAAGPRGTGNRCARAPGGPLC